MALTPVGKHCILELHGCPFHVLDDELLLRDAVTEASSRGMSTLLSIQSHRFHPQGATVLALLAESHISVHTWPESGYAAADVFTCGEMADPVQACELLARRLKAKGRSLRVLSRGGGDLEDRGVDLAGAGEGKGLRWPGQG